MLVQTSYVVTSYLAFPTPWCLSGRTSAGMVLLHLCSTVIFRFLMKKWHVCVISRGMCPTTVKQLYRCTATAYLSCYFVLLTKCLKLFTNTRTPYALVHMMAAHTAFDYELVTRGSGCTWSLCHFHFH